MDITQQQRATDFQKGTLNIYVPVMGFKGVRCRSYINREGKLHWYLAVLVKGMQPQLITLSGVVRVDLVSVPKLLSC